MTGWAAFWIFCSVSAICGTYFSARVVRMAQETLTVQAAREETQARHDVHIKYGVPH